MVFSIYMRVFGINLPRIQGPYCTQDLYDVAGRGCLKLRSNLSSSIDGTQFYFSISYITRKVISDFLDLIKFHRGISNNNNDHVPSSQLSQLGVSKLELNPAKYGGSVKTLTWGWGWNSTVSRTDRCSQQLHTLDVSM